jgi:hypothetical protein
MYTHVSKYKNDKIKGEKIFKVTKTMVIVKINKQTQVLRGNWIQYSKTL